MSIRITGCYLYVLFFAWYARKNWYVSACAAIALMAVIQHPDMPKNVFGIQGLNPWNILFLPVLVCWWFMRPHAGHPWDMPGHVMFCFLAYAGTAGVSILRLLVNPSDWFGEPFSYMISEYVINCVKWVLPGLLLYEGCRSRRHAYIAIAVILLLYTLLAVQVIRWVPFGAGQGKAARYIQNEIGYNRVTLSMMLSGASWAMLATLMLVHKWKHKLVIVGLALGIAFGQALTGGRTGYIAWLGVGLVLGLVRWRKLLAVIPIAALGIVMFIPGVKERILQGAGQDSGPVVVQNDEYEMTSGRNIAWPAVIEQIKRGPIVGFGRTAMATTGVTRFLMEEYNESFPHPHQAYLEILLDSGIVGFLCIMPFYFVVLYHGLRLLRDRDDPLVCVVGGIGCALVLALLFGAFGGQTFYPREGSVGMWAAIGLMLRFSVERTRQPYGRLFADDEDWDEVVEPEDEADERQAGYAG